MIFRLIKNILSNLHMQLHMQLQESKNEFILVNIMYFIASPDVNTIMKKQNKFAFLNLHRLHYFCLLNSIVISKQILDTESGIQCFFDRILNATSL